jgi:hypothetical protein
MESIIIQLSTALVLGASGWLRTVTTKEMFHKGRQSTKLAPGVSGCLSIRKGSSFNCGVVWQHEIELHWPLGV